MGAKGQPKTPGSGRKPKFASAEELKEKIDAYFEDCKGKIAVDPDTGEPYRDKWGGLIMDGAKPLTMTGLARALGFTSRKGLNRYQGKKEFEDLIRDARMRVEEYSESRLYDRDGVNGAKFNLEVNFGWGKDEDEQTGNGAAVNIICDIPRVEIRSRDGAQIISAPAVEHDRQAGTSEDGS